MSSTTAAPCSRSATEHDPLRGFLPEFPDWLEKAGLSANQVASALRASRHFLVWLQYDGTPVDRIDDAALCRFRHHDCRCAHSRHGNYKRHRRSSRDYMFRVRWLVRFLEESGRVSHPGELGEGLRLAEEFIETRRAEGFAPTSLLRDHSACRHFLVWLHGSRIPMAEVDRIVLDRFLDHDCLCPGYFRSLTERADQTTRYTRPIEAFMAFLAGRGSNGIRVDLGVHG